MDVQLFRIDDRLIHGQVVLGWAKPLRSERILLCDDEVSQSAWEKELYCTCVPEELQALVCNVDETINILSSEIRPEDKTIVLVKEPRVVMDIVNKGYVPGKVNLGGLHFSDQRKKYLSYVYLNDEEIKQLHWLLDKGVSIYCQDVPTSKARNVLDVID
ncbi:MAG: PTS sugar transporter subunit IIB [Calditrichia bacterium]|nr:PTS sugar transporter subunit IIB [Calditrichia bacterium]